MSTGREAAVTWDIRCRWLCRARELQLKMRCVPLGGCQPRIQNKGLEAGGLVKQLGWGVRQMGVRTGLWGCSLHPSQQTHPQQHLPLTGCPTRPH